MGRKQFQISDLLGFDLSNQELSFVIEYSKDFNAQRAAVVAGFAPGTGYQVRDRENVQRAVQMILNNRLEASHIDAEWVLMEAVDNHLLARQSENITASNTALKLIAQHTMVDAMASDKLNLNVKSDQALVERMIRARKRINGADDADDADDAEAPSFL